MLAKEHTWEPSMVQAELLPLPSHTSPSAKATTRAFELAQERSLLGKRVFDITVCLLLLPIVLPMMALVALAIRLDSKGGVIFSTDSHRPIW